MEVVSEDRDPEEETAEKQAHHQDGRGCVLRFRLAKRGNAVGNSFDTGKGDRARREAAQQNEEAERAADLVGALEPLRVEGHGLDVAEVRAVEPVEHQRADGGDVEVGRHGEDGARLLQAPQVGQGDHGDEAQPQQHPGVLEPAERGQGNDGRHTG